MRIHGKDHPPASRRLFPAAVSLGALLLGTASAQAGKVEYRASESSPASATAGSETEGSFNPTVTVVAQPGETIPEVLDRFAALANDAGGGQYVATRPGPYDVEILRTGGGELDALRLMENDPAVTFTKLTVQRPVLHAVILTPQETPGGGSLVVVLNGRSVPVVTTGHTPSTLAAAMLLAIQSAGFEAESTPPYIVVTRDQVAGSGLTVVGLVQMDGGLVTSEIALAGETALAVQALPSTSGVPTLEERGLLVLVLLLALAGLLLVHRRCRPKRWIGR